jgi:hypothetical protein
MAARRSTSLPFPALLLILLACAAWPVPAAAQRSSVAVATVVDSATGQPLAAARVTVDGGRPVLTDRDGHVLFPHLAPGPHNATARYLGYRDGMRSWTEAGDTVRVRFALVPDPVELQALSVQVDRLEARRVGTGMVSRTANLVDMQGRVGDAAKFAADYFALHTARCPQPPRRSRVAGLVGASDMQPSNCLRVRGDLVKPCVLMDEAPINGMEGLADFQPGDLYRIEVYQGGRMILVYSPGFVQSMARRKLVPPPADGLYNAYCRATSGTPGL